MEEGTIIDLFLNRKEEAIEEAKRLYGSRLRALAKNLGLSDEDADEIENDTYLAAWKKIPPNEPYGYLFRFLAKIAREKAIDLLRAKDRRERSVRFVELTEELENVLPSMQDVETEIEGREIVKLISGFLRKETPERRQMFIRRYWFLEPIEAIAARYAFSQSKVKSMLLRTRRELRTYLEQEGYTL